MLDDALAGVLAAQDAVMLKFETFAERNEVRFARKLISSASPSVVALVGKPTVRISDG